MVFTAKLTQETPTPTLAAHPSPGSCLHLQHSGRRAGNGGGWVGTWADATTKEGGTSWLNRLPSTSATLTQHLLCHSILLHHKHQCCPLHHILAQASPSSTSRVPGQEGTERQEHLPALCPMSIPNATQRCTSSPGKAVISHSVSSPHKYEQSRKHLALDNPKSQDNSFCLVQVLSP